jgi:signal transduction histidine kinase
MSHSVPAGSTVQLTGEAGPDRIASWPLLGATSSTAPGVAIPVVDRTEKLGSITVEMPAGRPLRAREHRLLADLADQAGMAFRNIRLTAELSGEVEQLSHRTDELAQSRRRLITAGDAERSRLERAIAEQVITHVAPLPNRLRQLSKPDAHATTAVDAALLAPLVESLNTALEALREITRGVFPAQLARCGLPTALGSLLTRARSTARLVVEDSASGRRFEPRVEAAAYFCVAEATRDLADPVAVVLSAPDDHLQLVVSGSGRGRLPLSHVRDRVEAAGGSLSITGDDGQVVIEIRAPTQVTAY